MSRESPRGGAFLRYVRGAIALGERHAPEYARLTGGASLPVSSRMRRAGRVMLPVAAWFDWQARRYSSAVPLLHELFPMVDGEPPCPTSNLSAPNRPYEPEPRAIRVRVDRARQAGGYDSAAAELSAELNAMSAAPCHDCMVRHLLESARRLCTLAPVQLIRVRACGLPPADGLLSRLFQLHLTALSAAAEMDARALPIQRAGVPIICADLPPLPQDAEQPLLS